MTGRPMTTSCSSLPLASERRDVCARDAAVDEEGRRRDEAGLVGGEEEHGVGHLPRLAETAHRHVDEAPRGTLLVLGEKLLEERGVDRTGAQRVDADPLPGELHAELTGHREHPALARA